MSSRPIRSYRSFFVSKPSRFVIDIKGEWHFQGLPKLKMKNDHVGGMRFGVHPEKLRVVIDLKGQQRVSWVIKESSNGLVLTIE
ncbi:MAG: AMIN domain-containing protein [Deltaproteobacteria bacterium]|nr:AMIN domain-containing protein [Deltaproteobacteria bacterium]